ncbi:hypothetical protein B0A53_05681 [Rhodotorula sp. CCFEE 5036]|nr:hypothetical protein B0A53_05681 [Rhodotorula sp. CCFEE 5036]
MSGAIDYTADTEFNDALRRHGIIPPKQSTQDGSRSPSPPPRPASPTLSEELDLQDLDINRDDRTRREDLERALEERKRHERDQLGKRKFGRVYPIGKVDYKREVTEASNEELPGEPEGWGTGVVCVLFKDTVPESKKLMPIIQQLAALYPSTKFVSIVSDHCIENYPDKNVPTLIIYRKGQMMGQVVGLGAMNGMNATLRDVERVLFAFRGIDFHNKVGYDAAGGASSSQFASRSDAATPFSSRSKGEDRDRNSSDSQDDDDSDDEDENEDPTMVGGGRRSGIRRGGGVKKKKAGEEDSDSDFDL